MRKVSVILALLAAPATAMPALALQAGDAMSAWRTASEQERSELLKHLPGVADKPGLRRCMDETSSVAGHADLPIAEVAKACASSRDDGQPV